MLSSSAAGAVGADLVVVGLQECSAPDEWMQAIAAAVNDPRFQADVADAHAPAQPQGDTPYPTAEPAPPYDLLPSPALALALAEDSDSDDAPAPDPAAESAAPRRPARVSHYDVVAQTRLWGIGLLVLAKRDLLPLLTEVHSVTVATGVGGLLGNKGCAATYLRVAASPVLFICSHLAAREERLADRNRDYQRILRGVAAKLGPKLQTAVDVGKSIGAAAWSQPCAAHRALLGLPEDPDADAGKQQLVTAADAVPPPPGHTALGACPDCAAAAPCAHTEAAALDLWDPLAGTDLCLWLGDLNYRVVTSFDIATQLCYADKLHSLFLADQLNHERHAHRAFAGFIEPPVVFAPTYRWQRDRHAFSNKRAQPPSWTDRVLVHTDAPHRALFASYGARHRVMGSDHRPVVALVLLEPRPVETGSAAPLPQLQRHYFSLPTTRRGCKPTACPHVLGGDDGDASSEGGDAARWSRSSSLHLSRSPAASPFPDAGTDAGTDAEDSIIAASTTSAPLGRLSLPPDHASSATRTPTPPSLAVSIPASSGPASSTAGSPTDADADATATATARCFCAGPASGLLLACGCVGICMCAAGRVRVDTSRDDHELVLSAHWQQPCFDVLLARLALVPIAAEPLPEGKHKPANGAEWAADDDDGEAEMDADTRARAKSRSHSHSQGDEDRPAVRSAKYHEREDAWGFMTWQEEDLDADPFYAADANKTARETGRKLLTPRGLLGHWASKSKAFFDGSRGRAAEPKGPKLVAYTNNPVFGFHSEPDSAAPAPPAAAVARKPTMDQADAPTVSAASAALAVDRHTVSQLMQRLGVRARAADAFLGAFPIFSPPPHTRTAIDTSSRLSALAPASLVVPAAFASAQQPSLALVCAHQHATGLVVSPPLLPSALAGESALISTLHVDAAPAPREHKLRRPTLFGSQEAPPSSPASGTSSLVAYASEAVLRLPTHLSDVMALLDSHIDVTVAMRAPGGRDVSAVGHARIALGGLVGAWVRRSEEMGDVAAAVVFEGEVVGVLVGQARVAKGKGYRVH
jgi:phosphatidylinositol-bisphosphatase